MITIQHTTQAIENEVIQIISTLTRVHPNRLSQVRDLTQLGLDIIDVVDIILEVEKAYGLTIPDEVPVYSVDDFVSFVYNQSIKQAS
ncbi:acyl carrier protein [Pontibacter actiniarum]|uniref:acyl carrier protein n=1 Tax=Pontibacter actiniarum TaxID=323450 RepID=UPI0003F7A000|nr:acyl carrier protein [Pontibacter actiniarum]